MGDGLSYYGAVSGIELVAGMGVAAVVAEIKSAAKRIAFKPFEDWLRKHNSTEEMLRAEQTERAMHQLRRLEALEHQAKRLEAEGFEEEKRARLEHLIGDHQFVRVQRNLELEGVREAMDERREMLAYAAAGAFSVELSLGDISRVERVLRELDPAGVRLLERIHKCSDEYGEFDYDEYGMGETAYLWDDPHFDSLVTAGCVLRTWREGSREVDVPIPDNVVTSRRPGTRIDPRKRMTIPRLEQHGLITTTGEHVLNIMKTYLQAKQPALPEPVR